MLQFSVFWLAAHDTTNCFVVVIPTAMRVNSAATQPAARRTPSHSHFHIKVTRVGSTNTAWPSNAFFLHHLKTTEPSTTHSLQWCHAWLARIHLRSAVASSSLNKFPNIDRTKTFRMAGKSEGGQGKTQTCTPPKHCLARTVPHLFQVGDNMNWWSWESSSVIIYRGNPRHRTSGQPLSD